MATQSYTAPGTYTFSLPVSTNITIRVAGAAGGNGGTDVCVGGAPNVDGGDGGRGRYAEFTLPDNTFGEFTFVVGGAGGNGLNVGQTAFAGGSGGFNGGGTGGDDRPGGSSGGGGGGGGLSSVNFNGTDIAIAGGGGGGGGASLCNYSGPVDSGFAYDGGDSSSFSSTTSTISISDGVDGDGGASAGGDGGGVGGGGGGAPGGSAGPSAGNDQQGGAGAANRAAGGLGGSSLYRSDVLTLSSQSTNTVSLNGYIEIEYTKVTFGAPAISISKAGPYNSSGSISFSSLRRNFRAQVKRTSFGGSETFNTDTAAISASDLIRDTNTSNANPIVPDATENANITSSQSNWTISDFRNSIKYYYMLLPSTDEVLNFDVDSQSWNSNFNKTINKVLFVDGTCGSTSPTQPALEVDADVYNLSLLISGSVLGAGGSSGAKGDKNQSDGSVIANAANGTDGGDAIHINTNSTGTVTVKTSGSSPRVYGGGGGGGGGGWGGNGADGSYTTYYTYYVSGGGGSVSNGSPTYYVRCQQACANAGGEWWNNCYKHISEGGQNCGGNPGDYWSAVCYSDDATRVANTTSCRKTVTGSTSNPSYGGHGGDGTVGGVGQGYLQSKTTASNAPTLGQTNGPTARSHSSAGNAGVGGKGGSGGDWGETGNDGNDGSPGYYSNGTTVYQNGGSKGSAGAAGAAVAGSGYAIDSSGVDSAYKGSK